MLSRRKLWLLRSRGMTLGMAMAAIPIASADACTVKVTLAGGQMLTFNVNVPAGHADLLDAVADHRRRRVRERIVRADLELDHEDHDVHQHERRTSKLEQLDLKLNLNLNFELDHHVVELHRPQADEAG